MTDIVNALLDLKLNMRLDGELRTVSNSLSVIGPPLATDGSGAMSAFSNITHHMLDNMMKRSAMLAGQRFATGDRTGTISAALPGGRNLTLHEVVEGRVTHAGRPAVLFRINADLPPGIAFAMAGYSVIDQATGLPLVSEVSTAKVEQGIGRDTLLTTRYTMQPPN